VTFIIISNGAALPFGTLLFMIFILFKFVIIFCAPTCGVELIM